jgi:hypothetical protein
MGRHTDSAGIRRPRRTLTTVPITLLSCADPLRPTRTDPHFARDARAARDLGAAVALIDHDALQRGAGGEAIARVPRDLGPAWYRGWMTTAAEYTALAAALTGRGTPPAVPPEHYRAAHELPGWYDAFAALTPASVWSPVAPHRPPEPAALTALVRPLRPGPLVIKDYVKSRKHEWDEACHVPDGADTARLHATVTRLVELAGDGLAGGVVVREFEEYAGAEVRVWWIDGDPVLVGPHPDTPDDRPGTGARGGLDTGLDAALPAVGTAVGALGCRFVTTDLARRTDGVWRVVEVGDGQVSDLPVTADPAALLARLPATTPTGG